MVHPTQITDDQFESEVIKSSTPVLVDFWAEWCGPCKAELPVLNRFARKHPDVVLLGLAIDSGGPETLAAAKEDLGIEFAVIMTAV